MSLTKEQKRERVRGLKALADSYAAATSPDELIGRVPTLTNRFSFRNVCLILSQRPHAIECAGFNEWMKVGRKVSKGAKGIAILVPMRKTSDHGEGSLWFSWRYVYDVADTEAVKKVSA